MAVLQQLLAFVKKINQKNNIMSSPFQQHFSSKSPLLSYESPGTDNDHPSNAAVVAAIGSVGKIAGKIVGNKLAKKRLSEVDTQVDVESLGKDRKPTIAEKIAKINNGKNPLENPNFGLVAEIPQPQLSDREISERKITPLRKKP